MREKGRRERKEGEREREREEGRKGRVLLHEGKGVDKEAYEDAYAMRTSTCQGGAL